MVIENTLYTPKKLQFSFKFIHKNNAYKLTCKEKKLNVRE